MSALSRIDSFLREQEIFSVIYQPFLWEIFEGESPLFATAIHNGHTLLKEHAENININSDQRFREEDPFTQHLTHITDNRIIAHMSRFQADLNRPKEQSVYLQPEDAWGLHVFTSPPSPQTLQHSYAIHDQFYADVHNVFTNAQKKHGCFVVLDLHSYNHRRLGPTDPPEDPQANPEINIGTISLDRQRWGGLVERLKEDLTQSDFFGRQLDVRENIKFQGRGYFANWIHTHFPQSACALAIEYKKFYMDEWTGGLHIDVIQRLSEILASTVPGIMEELEMVQDK